MKLDALGLELVRDAKGRTEAFYITGRDTQIGPELVAALKERLAETGAGAVRVCLHPGPEAPVHDMIIVHKAGGDNRPHKHLAKEETYHMIEGRMRLEFYGESGALESALVLGAPGSGLPFAFRVRPNTWHATIPETEHAVFHESRPGPFEGGDSISRT